MKPPCMIIVKHVLPAIRVLVAKELMEKYGMRKIDASEKMELTPAAITQYSKGERGASFIGDMAKSEETMKRISKLAETIAKSDSPVEEAIEQLCGICETIRAEELLCELHREELPALQKCKCPVCTRSV
ncbi:MAG: transcriptional regulator [Candidatus Bathyarchaeales archaeon]